MNETGFEMITFLEKFQEKLKQGHNFVVRECSICNAPIFYFGDTLGNLFCDTNCDCVSGYVEPKPRVWREVTWYIENDLEKVKAFLEQ